MTRAHVPVLAGELIELTAPAPGETVVDCTFGAGGHARLIADRIGPAGTLICIDRDPLAEEHFAELAREVACETRFLRMDYADGLALLREEGLSADVVYLDLGISSMQVDARERGFSYSYDAPLDMRMDTDQELTAEVVVNTYSAAQLVRILRDYGEERFAPRVASLIIKERAKDPITSTKRLADIVRQAIPAATRRTGGNPAKRTFQALRIEVNAELSALEAALPAALDALALGGRAVVLSYHSLEDRLTKQILTARTKDTSPPGLPVPLPAHQPRFRLLTRGAELPSEEELARNPRAASARMRAAERIRVDDQD